MCQENPNSFKMLVTIDEDLRVLHISSGDVCRATIQGMNCWVFLSRLSKIIILMTSTSIR